MNSYVNYLENIGRAREIAKLINDFTKELESIEPSVQIMMAGYPSTKYFSNLTSASKFLAEQPDLEKLSWDDIYTQANIITDAITNISGILKNRKDLTSNADFTLDKIIKLGSELERMCLRNVVDEHVSSKNLENIGLEENKYLRQKVRELGNLLDESSKEIDSIKSRVDTAIKEKTLELEKTAETINNNYVAFDDRMKSKETTINNMLGRASGATISQEFSIYGIKELNLYYDFRKWVIRLLMLIPAVIVFLIFFAGQVAVLSTEFFLRLSLIVSLIALATYLARESNKHRSLGNKYSQTGFYLNTLDPYLESLESSERNKIKSDLALKLFFSFEDKDAPDSMPVNLQEIINKLIDAIPKTSGK